MGAAVGFDHRDIHGTALADPRHITQQERAGRHHGGVDQVIGLADLHSCRTLRNPLNLSLLTPTVQALFVRHLHAGDLRATEHRVAQQDFARLHHGAETGKGPLRVGVNVLHPGHAVIVGVQLIAAHYPVASIEPGLQPC